MPLTTFATEFNLRLTGKSIVESSTTISATGFAGAVGAGTAKCAHPKMIRAKKENKNRDILPAMIIVMVFPWSRLSKIRGCYIKTTVIPIVRALTERKALFIIK